MGTHEVATSIKGGVYLPVIANVDSTASYALSRAMFQRAAPGDDLIKYRVNTTSRVAEPV